MAAAHPVARFVVREAIDAARTHAIDQTYQAVTGRDDSLADKLNTARNIRNGWRQLKNFGKFNGNLNGINPGGKGNDLAKDLKRGE